MNCLGRSLFHDSFEHYVIILTTVYKYMQYSINAERETRCSIMKYHREFVL